MEMKPDNLTQVHDIEALNALHLEGETCDVEIFSEMRSNLLLVSGEHYNRKYSNFFRRLRETKELNSEQKIRLTKNHVQKICKIYSNNIIALAPGVGFEPKNSSELSDQKAAELHESVWQDACEKYSIETDRIDEWADCFVNIGEVATKIFYDPQGGPVTHFEQLVDEASGQPMFDQMGQPMPDKTKPVFAGAFVFEDIYGFNLRRDPSCKTMDESSYLEIQKMVPLEKLKKMFEGDPEVQKFIKESQDETFIVFDNARGGYQRVKNHAAVREYYFRQSARYPEGYFFITTKEGILAQGVLPGSIFPIVYKAYETIPTTPRGRSPIKQMRPYQVEINRSASKIAEHQITLGDDKLLIQNGTKVSPGMELPGVRSINYTGQEPGVLPGRDGSQYTQYMLSQIQELYQVMGVEEDTLKDQSGQEPYTLLFQAASKKRYFQRNVRRFESFLVNVCKTYLKLAKVHLPDDQTIYAVGRNEQINIPEFKNAKDICYQIKVEPQSDDIETKLGKQMVLNHALQYAGAQLKPEDMGKILRQMPYANFDESFDDLTIDYDSAVNDILALDRGQMPQVNQYDNHVYLIKRLSSRMRKADFPFLPPQVQQLYAQIIDQHQQIEAQNQLAVQRAKSGYIPTDGYMAVCDLYVPDPKDPTTSKRARIPYSSLQWLVQQLEAQGQDLQQLEDMNQGAQAQIANKMSPTQPGGQANPPNQGHMAPQGPGMSPWQIPQAGNGLTYGR